MEIEISDDIMADPASLSEVYTQLKAFRHKHRLSYNSYKELMNNEKLSDDDKGKFKELFTVTTNLIKFRKKIRVVKNKIGVNEILVHDLNEILSNKAIVILENEHQDLDFIFACLNAVTGGPDLLKLYKKMWSARGAGGCGDIPKLIAKCADEHSGVARILVVNDSDKYHSAHQIGVAQQNIIQTAQQYHAFHVMLKKREIENYIPIKILESIYSPKYPKINYLKHWNREQRDYFDMKTGFVKNCLHTDPKYNNIYHNLPQKHIDAFLNSGFGGDISRSAFNKVNIALFTKENLDIEDPSIYNEFCEIKNKIIEIL